TLPGPRQSFSLWGMIFLNNRGFVLPAPVADKGAGVVAGAFIIGLLAAVALVLWTKHRQARTGARFPVLWAGLALLITPPLAAMLATGLPIGMERPELRGFNFVGGIRLIPEFVALLLALTIYTAAFIAET